MSDNPRSYVLRYPLAFLIALIATGCSDEPLKAEPVIRPVKIAIVGNTGAEGERELPGTMSDRLVGLPRIGGLHHRCEWSEAA